MRFLVINGSNGLGCRVLGVALIMLSASMVYGQVPDSGSSSDSGAYVLRDAGYEVFSSDVNLDGHPDLLLRSSARLTLLPLRKSVIPLVLPPISPTFALFSMPDGGYDLEFSLLDSTLRDPSWKPARYRLVYGDVHGDGIYELLLDPQQTGYPALLIESANTGVVLIQLLDKESINADLSSSGTSAELTEVNDDQRADLVVRVDGVVFQVVIASEEGQFFVLADPDDEDEQSDDNDQAATTLIWKEFCGALEASDIEAALRYVSSDSQQRYREAFIQVPDLSAIAGHWSDFRPVSIGRYYAEYSLTQTVLGQEETHMITFVKEGDRWVLQEF